MFGGHDETIEYPDLKPFIVGIVERAGQPPILCYDRDAVIAHFALDMGYDDAVEYFEFNTLGTYAGPFTPCFITLDRSVAAECGGTASGAIGSGADSGAVPDGDVGGDSE